MDSFYNASELSNIGFKSCGKNVLISRNACIYGAENMTIGDNVRIDDFCILSGKIQVDNYVHIAANVGLFAGNYGIHFNDFTTISSRGAVYAVSDDYSGEGMTNPTIPDMYRKVYGGKVVFGKHAIIGTGSIILPGVNIGEGVSVGSMSLVIKDLEDWFIYVGIPCKKIKERSKQLLKLEEEFVNECRINL